VQGLRFIDGNQPTILPAAISTSEEKLAADPTCQNPPEFRMPLGRRIARSRYTL